VEFVAKKSDLFRELSAVQSVSERKTTIPILASVLFRAENGLLHIAATDLDCSLRTTCLAAISKEGAITLPARKLLDYIKLLPEGDVFFSLAENNWVNIRAGRSKTKMIGMAASNFPVLPAFPAAGTEVPIPVFSALIQKTIFAVSDQESRYALGCTQLELSPESVAMVATDGHRLGYLKIDKPLPGITGATKLLVPKKALGTLMALLTPYEDGMVTFAHDDNSLFFKIANKMLTARKTTGQFPNYVAVLPKEQTISVVLDSAALRNSLQRVAQFADERVMSVKMHFEANSLVLSAHTTEKGGTEETLDVEYVAEPITTAFNANYIRDILRSIPESDRVRLILKDKSSPAEFQPVTGMELTMNRQIVMPCR
jgi:DNA polymerase III subunit beta